MKKNNICQFLFSVIFQYLFAEVELGLAQVADIDVSLKKKKKSQIHLVDWDGSWLMDWE